MKSDHELSAEQVGNALRALVDEHARPRLAADARASWRRVELSNPVAARPRFGWQWKVAGTALLTAAAAGALLLTHARTLSYTLHGVQDERGVLATHAHSGAADFSDHSRLGVDPETTFNVDVTGRHAARARLVKGTLHVAVTHAEDTNWSFLAGPYEVRVIGTEFDLSYDPDGSRFAVAMKKGAVCVLAPDGTVRALKAGESLQLPTLPTPEPSAVVALAAAADSAPAIGASDAAATHADKSPSGSAPRPGVSQASWEALVAKGAFVEVVHLAEAAGIEQSLGTRSATDVKALAQAAHYSGHADLSLRAWTALRERFARSAFAQQSSFFQGRIYEDQGNLTTALKWFNTYSTEAPGGVYAAEALGRRLSLLERLRGRAGATQQAREYLDRFPGGAYAPTARKILSEN
jgi:hypothetical protein